MADSKNTSKKELLEERKRRKIEKRKTKWRTALISFFIKAVGGLLAVILVCLGAVGCQNQARPPVQQADTFPYTGKCVDAYKKNYYRGRGRSTTKTEVYFEDGRWYRWDENTFSDSEIESMIGSNLILTMGKRMDGTEFPVEVRHENGYVYRTLEEYNADQAEQCRTTLQVTAVCSSLLYILFLIVVFPYKHIPYRHKRR